MTTANYIVVGITALVAFGMPITFFIFSILISRDEKTAISSPKQKR